MEFDPEVYAVHCAVSQPLSARYGRLPLPLVWLVRTVATAVSLAGTDGCHCRQSARYGRFPLPSVCPVRTVATAVSLAGRDGGLCDAASDCVCLSGASTDRHLSGR